MQNAELYPRYRFVMGALDILCGGLTHVVNMLAAPLLIFLAADFGVDEATAGYASTLHIAFQGIFMFIGPMLVGLYGNKKVQQLGLTVVVVGSIFSYIAPSFGMLMAARMLTGAGHGLSGSCTAAIIAAWFPPKERPIATSALGMFVAAVTLITYTCTVPLYHALGDSWRLVFLLMGGVVLVIDVIWLIFARDNHALDSMSGDEPSAFAGIREAVSRKDAWLLWLLLGFFSIGANGMSTYIPQFLHNVRGYTEAAASSVVGIGSGLGMAASLLGGVVTAYLGKRRPVVIPTYLACIVFVVLSLTLNAHFAITAAFTMYMCGYNFQLPATQTISMELPGSTPALVSSVASISVGIGFVGTLCCAPLLKLATGLLGEERSMLVFVPMFVLALVFALLMPETGPGKQTKNT